MKPTFPLIIFYDKVLDLIPQEENLRKASLSFFLQGTSKHLTFDASNKTWSYEIKSGNIKNNFLTKLLANTIYNPSISVTPQWNYEKNYELDELKKLIYVAIDNDDDILTQFVEADKLKQLLHVASSFKEIYDTIFNNVYEYDEKIVE